jgi:hypothetical protein
MLRNVILVVVAAAGLAWLAQRFFTDDAEPGEPADRAATALHDGSATTARASAPSAAELPAAPAAAAEAAPSPDPDPEAAAHGAQDGRARELILSADLSVPNRSAASSPLRGLMDTLMLRCQFDPGHGANWSNGNPVVHSAAFQGGPVVYQIVDLDFGQAFAQENTGTTEVRVAATNTGFHFSGFTRRGELVVVTAYAAVDQSGSYRAVMSRHGMGFENESAQFYGSCDTSLTKLPTQ